MLKNKKILPILVLLIIIVGVIVLAIKGMNYGLIYGNNTTIKMNLGKQVEVEDIAKEIFEKEYNVKLVNNHKENVLITAKSVSEEQISTLISKINEKYELSISNEDLEITNNSKMNGKYLIKQRYIDRRIDLW